MRFSRICATKAPCGELFFRQFLGAAAVLDNPETVFPNARDAVFSRGNGKPRFKPHV
jgi:hypothetical protein